jgi:hypothetical protein
MKSKFGNNPITSDSFGNTLRDEVLKFQLDHRVAQNLEVKLENGIALISLYSQAGDKLSEASFKYKGDRGELLNVMLVPEVNPETGETQTPQLWFSFEHGDLYCDLTDLYDVLHELDAKIDQEIADREAAIAQEVIDRDAAIAVEAEARGQAIAGEAEVRALADEIIHDRLDNIQFNEELPAGIASEVLKLVRDGEHYYKLHDKRVKVIEKTIESYINGSPLIS